MTRTRAGWTGVALCGVFVLGGTATACSKNETATPTTTTAAAGASTTTAKTSGGDSGDGLPVGELTKAELIVKVDAICVSTREKIAQIPEPKSEADFGDYLDQGLVLTKQELEDIEALGAPKDDADAYREAIKPLQEATTLLEQKLPALKKDPTTMSSDTALQKATDAANASAKSYGFKECGKSSGSGGSANSTTTR